MLALVAVSDQRGLFCLWDLRQAVSDRRALDGFSLCRYGGRFGLFLGHFLAGGDAGFGGENMCLTNFWAT